MEIDDESDLQREKLPVTNGHAFTLFSCSSILLPMKLQFHGSREFHKYCNKSGGGIFFVEKYARGKDED